MSLRPLNITGHDKKKKLNNYFHRVSYNYFEVCIIMNTAKIIDRG